MPPRSRDLPSLDPEQQAAVDAILKGDALVSVLTGKAGTGKSRTVTYLRKAHRITVAATTGKAALNVGGITVDTLFQFSRKDHEPYTLRSGWLTDRNMRDSSSLIIVDEAPMVGKNMGNAILNRLQMYGKRLLLVGDWAQAVQVKDDWITESGLWYYTYAHQHVHKLTTIHRQSDADYLAALDDIRQGIGDSQRVLDIFRPRVITGPPPDDSYMRLHATNRAVDSYNAFRMSTFGNCFEFRTIALDERDNKERPLPDNMFTRAEEDSPFPSGNARWFAVGCRVVVTSNAPPPADGESGMAYVNGDTGVLVDVEWTKSADRHGRNGDFPRSAVVLLDRTGEEVEVFATTRSIVDAREKPVITVYGIPLRLGYAMTIHKAQGMTVQKCYVDVDTICQHPAGSRHGLAYVALSRTTALDGLRLSNWNPRAIESAWQVKDLI